MPRACYYLLREYASRADQCPALSSRDAGGRAVVTAPGSTCVCQCQRKNPRPGRRGLGGGKRTERGFGAMRVGFAAPLGPSRNYPGRGVPGGSNRVTGGDGDTEKAAADRHRPGPSDHWSDGPGGLPCLARGRPQASSVPAPTVLVAFFSAGGGGLMQAACQQSAHAEKIAAEPIVIATCGESYRANVSDRKAKGKATLTSARLENGKNDYEPTRITRTSITFVPVRPVRSRSPVALKKV